MFYVKMFYYSQNELEHFGLEMSLVYGILAYFEFKFRKIFELHENFKCNIVLNIFQYIFETKCLKIRQEKLSKELYKVLMWWIVLNIFTKWLSAFVILVGWWSAGFKYLTKDNLKHSLTSIFGILINHFLGCSTSFGNFT